MVWDSNSEVQAAGFMAAGATIIELPRLSLKMMGGAHGSKDKRQLVVELCQLIWAGTGAVKQANVSALHLNGHLA